MPNHPEIGMSPATTVPYREIYESDSGCSWIEREVLMAAHEGSEHAEQAERREIGDATLEQLRADVVRLSGDSMTTEPLPLFMEMRRVRNRTHTVLDRRVWPRDQAEVCFLLGCLNALMANTANDLGYPSAAGELARAGWAYAVAIGHRSLMGHLRWVLANVADWSGQPRHAQDLAAGGLEYLPEGPTAALLHLKRGRAAARLGDTDAARVSIAAAAQAAEDDRENELTQIGGEFTLSRASQHYLAGSVLVEIPGAERDAAAELDHASLLYSAGPAPGEAHGFGMEALARINLAIAQLRAGALDTAANAAQPVLTLPPGKRIATLPQCFGRVRAELAQPVYRGSAQARQFDEQIETFCRETIVASLPANPG
jgi:hypothetical protein